MSPRKIPAGMFGSESELSQALIDTARASGYQAHPDVGEWDTLIVCRETGDQIGVHVTLRPSVEVLAHALTDEINPGPEIHAVLVPVATADFRFVARSLRVHLFEGARVDRLDLAAVFAQAERWRHPVRESAPEVQMSFAVGVPGLQPRRKPWQISLVKLCLLARKNGFVTVDDIKRLQLDLHRCLGEGFLERRVINGKSKRGEFVLSDASSPMVPDLHWPDIVSALQDEARVEVKQPRLRVKRREPPRSTMLPPKPAELPPVDLLPLKSALVAGYMDGFMEGRLGAASK